jgi:hypothetical protein
MSAAGLDDTRVCRRCGRPFLLAEGHACHQLPGDGRVARLEQQVARLAETVSYLMARDSEVERDFEDLSIDFASVRLGRDITQPAPRPAAPAGVGRNVLSVVRDGAS